MGTLHLDNNSAKGYLFNPADTVYLFLSRLSCCILNLAEKPGITLIPECIHTDLITEANYLTWGRLVSRMASSSHGSSGISTLGSACNGFVEILTYQSMSLLITLVESPSCRILVEHFQPSLNLSGG